MTASSPFLPRVILLMGVCGSGKSRIGELLAAETGGHFADADDYHPPENRAKMSAGIPLTDADRQPWLATLRREVIDAAPSGQVTVLACSALRRAYRDVLTAGVPDAVVVHLDGSAELIAARLAARRGHFMPPGLLASQLAALEVPAPDEALLVSIDGTPEEIVSEIRRRLRGGGG